MASMPSIEVNLGDTIPYLAEKFLSLIGKDAATVALREWFSGLQRAAYVDASTVQCIGMHTPVPIADIYRPTKLRWRTSATASQKNEKSALKLTTRSVTAERLLSTPTNAAIFAGPGFGKTTLLHHIFLMNARSEAYLPVLITLRRPQAVDDLCKFVDLLTSLHKQAPKLEFLLLVDGYDEISISDRKIVSQKLLLYSASGFGRYYLTCREFYDIYDLKLPHIFITPFDTEDQDEYAKSFAEAYGSSIKPKEVLQELRERGMNDILQHPLLLAMVCIIKSGSMNLHSNSVLLLMERALDTLAFRWDEGKGLTREQATPVDGRSRLHCVMRIAYSSQSTQVPESLVLSASRAQLDLLRWDKLNERQVMLETARFYGILVPLDEGNWQFVHRTLHDYLAARFWVEKAGFAPAGVKEWNARAAYAASLGMDATKSMLATLAKRETISAFVEMLSNDAPFDHPTVSNALIAHYQQFATHHLHEVEENHVRAMLAVDFVSSASTKFLKDLAFICANGHRSKAKDTLFAYSVVELFARGESLTTTGYSHAYRHFGASSRFTVNKYGAWKSVDLAKLVPKEGDESDPYAENEV